MEINLMKLVLCVYIFITIGVYLKRLNYKAPKSSIIYAPILPILSVLITSKILYKDIKEIKMKKFFKIIIFIVLEVQAIINNYMYTGLLCVVLGKANV